MEDCKDHLCQEDTILILAQHLLPDQTWKHPCPACLWRKGGFPSLQPGWDHTGEGREEFSKFCAAPGYWVGMESGMERHSPNTCTAQDHPLSLQGALTVFFRRVIQLGLP